MKLSEISKNNFRNIHLESRPLQLTVLSAYNLPYKIHRRLCIISGNKITIKDTVECARYKFKDGKLQFISCSDNHILSRRSACMYQSLNLNFHLSYINFKEGKYKL